MPSLLDSLETLFGTRDLYGAIGLKEKSTEATAAQLKKAYHRSSLKHHPDRVEPTERPDATKRFQALGAAYKILSDPDAKALYDESGEIDDEASGISNDSRDWESYWRLLFPRVSVADIKKFEAQYKNSAEEDEDLKQAYCDGEGSMEFIVDNVMCAEEEDEDRFAQKIKAWIKDKSVPEFPRFKKDMTRAARQKRSKARSDEAREAESYAKDIGLTGPDGQANDLASVIAKRHERMAKDSEGFLDALAAKYGAKPTKAKKAKKS